jgi:hypothetical protein
MYPPPSSHLNIGLATHAWALYRKYPWKWIAAASIACGIQAVIWLLIVRLVERPEPETTNPTLYYLFIMGLLALISGCNNLFQVGLCRLALDQLAGEPLRLGRLFKPTAGIGVTLLTSFVVALVTQLGYGMFYIPGLVLQGVFLLVTPILAERKLGMQATLKLSVETLQPELINAILFAMFLNFLTGFAGSAMSSPVWPLTLAGVIVVYPLVPQIQALLYRSYFPYRTYEYRG